jgi:putative FmdB family regulatory protein
MPTYQYKCKKCQNITNVVRGINDPETEQKCSTCKIKLTRVFSVGGVTFNGSGFYSKDK